MKEVKKVVGTICSDNKVSINNLVNFE